MADKLISLIESLNKREKLFFKKYISSYERQNGKNYIELFDAIDRLISKGKYKEEAILKKICKKPKGYNKNFSRTKLYLYKKILESLTALITGRSNTYKFYNYAKRLYSKNLFEQALVMLRKAKKNVIESELSNELISILEMEYDIAKKLKVKNYKKEIFHIEKDIKKTLYEIHNFSEYTYCLFIIKYWRKNFTALSRNKNFLKELDRVINQKIMKSPEFALTKRAKYLYYSVKMTYYYMCSDYENSYKHLRCQLDIMTQNKMFKSSVYGYMVTLRNISYIGILLKKFSDVKGFLTEFERLLSEKNSKIISIYLYSSMRCSYYLIKTEYIFYTVGLEGSDDLLEEIGIWAEANKSYLSKWDYYNLLFNLSTVYFLKGRLNTSLNFINKILNYLTTDNREEVFIPAKLLDLIIHYELNNTEYLGYKVKSLYRILSEENTKHSFGKVILGFINKFANANSREKLLVILEEFKFELERQSEGSMGKQLSEYFDFVSWVESKIENKPLTEILKRKSKMVNDSYNLKNSA